MSETGLAIARLKELTDRLTTMDERVEARHKILRIEECLVALAGNADRNAPIAMRLPCEKCGTLHIDVGKFATHPHHTHTCQNKSCGLTWRPAKEHTVGVRFIPGFEDQEPTERLNSIHGWTEGLGPRGSGGESLHMRASDRCPQCRRKGSFVHSVTGAHYCHRCGYFTSKTGVVKTRTRDQDD